MNALKEKDIDIIFIVGDMINDISTSHDKLVEFIEQIVEIAPVYYSLGNHEYAYENIDELREDLEAIGVHVLEDEYVDITIGDTTIRVGGMYDYAYGTNGKCDIFNMDRKIYRFLTDFENTDNYKIMLCHRPDSFIFGQASSSWSIDLVLSGHNHGGQVIIPLLGGVYGGDQGFFPEYDYGYFTLNNIHLLITRGLGSEDEIVPRINNIPEIVYFQLECES